MKRKLILLLLTLTSIVFSKKTLAATPTPIEGFQCLVCPDNYEIHERDGTLRCCQQRPPSLGGLKCNPSVGVMHYCQGENLVCDHRKGCVAPEDASSNDETISQKRSVISCDSRQGIETALGCIPIADTDSFINWFYTRLVGIAGGIAFLIMLFGSLKIITSGGDPEKVKEGKSLIVSAISGLLFMIFSMFLLQLIGVDILKLPGLTK